MAASLGARLGHMQSAWYAQIVLEQALQLALDARRRLHAAGRQHDPGESPRAARRQREGKPQRAHAGALLTGIPARARGSTSCSSWSTTNARAELFGGRFPLPARGARAPTCCAAPTLDGARDAIDARLARLAGRTGGVRLDIEFPDRLAASVARFNKAATHAASTPTSIAAAQLQDRALAREDLVVPESGHEAWPLERQTERHHVPVSRTAGPYYAIILAAGTHRHQRRSGDQPHGADARGRRTSRSPGCTAPATASRRRPGRACYGHGATFGPALAFAYLAGTNAAAAYEKSLV